MAPTIDSKKLFFLEPWGSPGGLLGSPRGVIPWEVPRGAVSKVTNITRRGYRGIPGDTRGYWGKCEHRTKRDSE